MPTDPKPAAAPRMSHAEWDLLEALWRLGRATARDAAAELAGTRGWAYSTVKTMLDRMTAKGFVHARQVGNVWEYTPAVEPAQARRSAWRRFVEAAFGGATAPALHFVVSESGLSAKEREALLAALAEPAVPSAGPRPAPRTRSRKKENNRD